jgi:hypothetical protein
VTLRQTFVRRRHVGWLRARRAHGELVDDVVLVEAATLDEAKANRAGAHGSRGSGIRQLAHRDPACRLLIRSFRPPPRQTVLCIQAPDEGCHPANQ